MDSIVISATYFNPRPSYEGRLLDILLGYAAAVFQSTMTYSFFRTFENRIAA